MIDLFALKILDNEYQYISILDCEQASCYFCVFWLLKNSVLVFVLLSEENVNLVY